MYYQYIILKMHFDIITFIFTRVWTWLRLSSFQKYVNIQYFTEMVYTNLDIFVPILRYYCLLQVEHFLGCPFVSRLDDQPQVCYCLKVSFSTYFLSILFSSIFTLLWINSLNISFVIVGIVDNFIIKFNKLICLAMMVCLQHVSNYRY